MNECMNEWLAQCSYSVFFLGKSWNPDSSPDVGLYETRNLTNRLPCFRYQAPAEGCCFSNLFSVCDFRSDLGAFLCRYYHGDVRLHLLMISILVFVFVFVFVSATLW